MAVPIFNRNMKGTTARQHSPLRWAIKAGVIVLIIAFFGALGYFKTDDQADPNLAVADFQREFIFEESNNSTDSGGEDDCPGFDSLKTDEERCNYLQNSCAPDGYINYLQIYYCSMPNIKWIAWIVFIVWLLIMFYGLGAAAGDYFCPSLSSIAEYLRMSPDVAGLTILALGNGAPDVSSTFAAVTSNTFNIAIGELLGAGLFVTTAVVAAVSFASEAFLDRKSFLRDTIFYLFGVVGVIIIVWDGKVQLFESILFLGYYFTYVGIALAVNYCKCGTTSKDFLLNEEDGEKAPLLSREGSVISGEDKPQEESFSFEGWRQEWSEKSNASKAFYIITLPVSVLLALTIPQSSQWNKYTALFVGVLSPVFSQWVLGYLTEEVTIGGKGVPVVAFTAAGGLVISLVIALLTKVDKKPKAYAIFTFWAFVLSILWIYIIANELVSFLQSIGYILNVSRIILGATVLAWGNSIGDMVADVLMARQGLPQMAISAAYGGPCFNLLFGLGLSFVVVCIKQYPQTYPVEATPLFYLTALFLVGSLAASIIVISISKFYINRKWGIVLLGVYLVYSVFLILGELHILF